MKISVNDQPLFELSAIQQQVIRNDIPDEIFEVDMQRRLHYILSHKYEQCMNSLKQEWLPKLKDNGVSSIPLDDDEFAKLVFSQPNYKSRSDRMDDNEKAVYAVQAQSMADQLAPLKANLK